MNGQNLITVSIDRLHAGMIGAYGNTWIRTPELNRLAAESFVFDQASVRDPRLEPTFDALWSDIGALQLAGLRTVLMTDDPAVAEHPLAARFAERIFVDESPPDAAAAEIEDTQFAQLFASALDWLTGAAEPFCLWLHSRGMAGPWDAPYALRDAYAEEDDPSPPEFLAPPNRMLSAAADPDEILGIQHAYAGQISALDDCVGALLDALREGPLGRNTLITLMATRGFPLGEHGRVGPCDDALYSELTQLAWMMRFPDGLGALARSQAMVEPSDLASTLLDWVGAPASVGHGRSLLPIARGDLEAVRDHLVLASENSRAISTPAWRAIARNAPQSEKIELYAKPSDRWEVNEISSRAPEIAAELAAILRSATTDEEAASVVPLAEHLVVEVE